MAKWHLRIIGIFFVLVSVPLLADYAQFGFRPETMHKVFHVLVGLILLRYGWNDPRWWRPFAVANGGRFTFVGLFGWLFPDLEYRPAVPCSPAAVQPVVRRRIP